MSRRLSRRSFLTCVVGSSIAGGGTFAQIGGARAQITDHDTGANADPAGRGRGHGAAITDTDSGATADPRGRGRGGAPRRPRCSNWTLNGTFQFVQSNNINGRMVLRQRRNRVTGTAYFYSPTLRASVPGRVEGSIDGTNFNLRIAWSWSGEVRGDLQSYGETGIYRGRIAGDGSIEGTNHPYNRPRDRTTWIMQQAATCISR